MKQAAQMRTAAQAELVLDENSEGEEVISYLSDLARRAERQQMEQQRIVHHQTFLNLPRMVNEDLALTKDEVAPPSPFHAQPPRLKSFISLRVWSSCTSSECF